MSLLSAGWIWLLGLVLLPVMLAIWQRRRVPRVRFGAAWLVERVSTGRSVRQRVWPVGQVVLRALALLGAVLAACEPVVGRWSGASAAEGRAAPAAGRVVVVVDASASMARGVDGSAWDAAMGSALGMLQRLAAAESVVVSVVPGGPHGAVLPAGQAISLLRGLEPTMQEADLAAAMVSALQRARALGDQDLRLLVVSDGQRSTWRTEDRSAWSQAAAGVAGRQVEVRLLGTGQAAGPNARIAGVSVVGGLLLAGETAELEVEVGYEGDRSQDGTLELFMNERLLASEVLRLEPGRATRLRSAVRPESAGDLLLRARIRLSDDLFAFDNELCVSLQVLDRLAVVMLESESVEAASGQPPLPALLGLALSPLRSGGIDAVRLRLSEATAEQLEAYRVIVLCDVPGLPSDLLSGLERAVIRGAGLWIICGPQSDASVFERQLHRGGYGLAPAGLERRVFAEGRAGRAGTLSPGWRRFSDFPGGMLDLATLQVHAHWAARPAADGGDRGRGLIHLEDGSPLLVFTRRGEGRVAQMLCSPLWPESNLGTLAEFVPLAQRLLAELGSEVTPPRNLRTGQSLQWVAAGDGAPRAMFTAAGPAAVQPWRAGADSAGDRSSGVGLALSSEMSGGLRTWSSGPIRQAGFVRVDSAGWTGPGFVAVRVPESESDLAGLGRGQIAELLAIAEDRVVLEPAAGTVPGSLHGHGGPWGLSGWLLGLCLLAMLGDWGISTMRTAVREHSRP